MKMPLLTKKRFENGFSGLELLQKEILGFVEVRERGSKGILENRKRKTEIKKKRVFIGI